MSKPGKINRKSTPVYRPGDPGYDERFDRAVFNADFGFPPEDRRAGVIYAALASHLIKPRQSWATERRERSPKIGEEYTTPGATPRTWEPFFADMIDALRNLDAKFFKDCAECLERMQKAKEEGAVDTLGKSMLFAWIDIATRCQNGHESWIPTLDQWIRKFRQLEPANTYSRQRLEQEASNLNLQFQTEEGGPLCFD